MRGLHLACDPVNDTDAKRIGRMLRKLGGDIAQEASGEPARL